LLARPGADRARAAGWDWQLDSVGSPKAKPAGGEGDDDDTADVGDGADHVDNGDVFTTEYLAHVCLFHNIMMIMVTTELHLTLMDITIKAALWLL
jgi:hypothetical protein